MKKMQTDFKFNKQLNENKTEDNLIIEKEQKTF